MQHHYPTSPNTVHQHSFEYEQPAPSSSSLVDRRRSPTARRLSPQDLIPHDAPTQSRRYITPSATSRRDAPSSFQRRSSYSRVSDEEEDELHEEPLGPNATEQEKIEYKRRQNTLAARRSRKRKLQQQMQLQEQVELLTKEKEIWKTRALTLRQLLLTHGILCPDFKD
ncbi:hypothetical protein FA15DRAFT_597543 [Coprinopsis marcescibilis]|uniref:BZIP domain-containing protein n=1 Tax=Coprinopsis marcescibilis TaxID=230819 RepID=A0A5C3KMF8_COPMA|nr:hypothetical protein FA15DRAFT_597543 [Coprinopsis marcescibilis]